jgi:hypothetical protein
MQRLSFQNRQLAAIALMLDEEEKTAALSDKKKRMWVHKFFRSIKSEGEYGTLYTVTTSYLTCHIMPHIYTPILLIFNPLLRQKQTALIASKRSKCSGGDGRLFTLSQWYSTFFVRVPPDIISLQLFTPKVVGA